MAEQTCTCTAFKGPIHYCPMHARAKNMREALDEAQVYCKLGRESADPNVGGLLNLLELIQRAVDGARGAARGGASTRDPAKETLDRIAALPREGENLNESGHHTLAPEYCQRSHAAAFQLLDNAILWARGGAA